MELVLDASVVIKWFLDEKLSNKALKYRDQHLNNEITLVAPSLLVFEITNALATKPEIDLQAILLAIESLYFTKIKECPFNKKQALQSAQLSKKYQISVYDAAYLALAQTLDRPFVTADQKLARKLTDLKFIQLLN